MYLFILESIGTSELILIGVIALIFLGPRRLPEIARKIGKITSEFRNTTNEFKQTWEREVNFEEEAKAFNLDDDDAAPVARVNTIHEPKTPNAPSVDAPQIREVDPAEFTARSSQEPDPGSGSAAQDDPNDKQNWL